MDEHAFEILLAESRSDFPSAAGPLLGKIFAVLPRSSP